jgi:hypothetical protein
MIENKMLQCCGNIEIMSKHKWEDQVLYRMPGGNHVRPIHVSKEFLKLLGKGSRIRGLE